MDAIQVQNQGTDIFGSSTLRDQLSKVDPALAEALSNFELSPRITTVCLMHHLAAVAKGTSADMTRPIHDVADAGKDTRYIVSQHFCQPSQGSLIISTDVCTIGHNSCYGTSGTD